MHLVFLLYIWLPEPLVDWASLSRPCCTSAGVALARRQSRRSDRRKIGQSRRSLSALSLPHDSELHAHLSEGTEPRQGHSRNQEKDRRASQLKERQKSGAEACRMGHWRRIGR